MWFFVSDGCRLSLWSECVFMIVQQVGEIICAAEVTFTHVEVLLLLLLLLVMVVVLL